MPIISLSRLWVVPVLLVWLPSHSFKAPIRYALRQGPHQSKKPFVILVENACLSVNFDKALLRGGHSGWEKVGFLTMHSSLEKCVKG